MYSNKIKKINQCHNSLNPLTGLGPLGVGLCQILLKFNRVEIRENEIFVTFDNW